MMILIWKCFQHKNLKWNSLFFIVYLYSWRWDVSRTLVTNLFFIRTFRVMAFESYSTTYARLSITQGVRPIRSRSPFLNLHLMCYQFLLISRIFFNLSYKPRWSLVRHLIKTLLINYIYDVCEAGSRPIKKFAHN